METRKNKINISKSGGTASKNARVYKLSLPVNWVKDMGIEENDRTVELKYNKETKEITIKKIDTE